ncbi:hypothetical protein PWT90_00859 [Aphanocladium album]|nr:hypothetical protein PWT90_00859 [Aphanocladium album]
MLSETLLVAALAGASAVAAPTPKPPLQFTADGKFHISVFNDIHFGESESSPISHLLPVGDVSITNLPHADAEGQGPLWDIKTAKLMGTIMDAENPQLVVLNGDLISGDQYKGADIIDHVDKIVKPIVARRLPWASTYGNHDSNYNLSRDQMFKREKTYNGSYTGRMVEGNKAGVTNYYLPVYAGGDACDATRSDNHCVPELLLWFFDSRGGKYYRTHSRQPNWVDTSVVDWYKDTNAKLTEQFGKVVPSIAFVHIPIHAAAILEKQGPGGHLDLAKHPGINDDVINGQGAGWTKDGRGAAKKTYGENDVAFMQALVDTKGLVGLFYGHDHGNTWCYRWNGKVEGLSVESPGLHLCYGQHTGYGGYGNWIRGGRQIAVTRQDLKSMTLKTHTRLETGEVVGAVTLNSTFNDDVYEKVPDRKTMLPLAGQKARSAAAVAKPIAGTVLTAVGSVVIFILL